MQAILQKLTRQTSNARMHGTNSFVIVSQMACTWGRRAAATRHKTNHLSRVRPKSAIKGGQTTYRLYTANSKRTLIHMHAQSVQPILLSNPKLHGLSSETYYQSETSWPYMQYCMTPLYAWLPIGKIRWNIQHLVIYS